MSPVSPSSPLGGVRAHSPRPDTALADACPRCSSYELLADIIRGMQWKVHSEHSIYSDPWIDVRCADVELPDGRHRDHRVVRTASRAGTVVVNGRREALLLWRHRFVTGSWGYEIPMERVDPSEDPVAAAVRGLEAAGCSPGPLQPLLFTEPANDLMDACRHIYLARCSTHTAMQQHADWIPLARIPALIASRHIVCGTTIAALLLAQAPGR